MAPRDRAAYLVRVDDIAPNMNWEAYRRAKALFEQYGVRPIIGVIPDNHDPELLRFPRSDGPFWDEIRSVQASGWEVAMHGFRHLYDSGGRNILGLRAPSEFANHPADLQLDRLRRAMTIFKTEGVPIRSFWAPSNTFDAKTIAALRELRVTSISAGYGLFPFRRGGLTWVPQLVSRPIAFPIGLHTSVHHLNGYSAVQFDRLERFLAAHHARVVSYDAALEMVRDHPLWRSVGSVIRWSLLTKWRLDRLMRRPRFR